MITFFCAYYYTVSIQHGWKMLPALQILNMLIYCIVTASLSATTPTVRVLLEM